MPKPQEIELYIEMQDIFLISGESYTLPCLVRGSPSGGHILAYSQSIQTTNFMKC